MASEKNVREFDFMVFGATGYTGKYVVEYIAKIEEQQLKWAVAGRSSAKVKEVLEEVSSITGKNVTDIAIFEADVTNEESLATMCQKAKLILNCVGPFRLYGEPVVKACIQNGSHYIDVCAESWFVETIQLKYHEEARKAGVYIVGPAGFDSIPCETGIQFLQQNFDGDVNSVETVVKLHQGEKRYKVNFGTYYSMMYHFAFKNKLAAIREQLFTKPLPRNTHPAKSRFLISYNREISSWCVFFPNTDDAVVNRTQYYNYHNRRMRPVHMFSSTLIPSDFIHVLQLVIGASLSFPLLYFKFGRYFLKKYPRLCTVGFISKSGPTRQQVEETSYSMYVVGHGYSTKLNDPDEIHMDKPNKTMVVKISAPEPAYVTTALCMVQTALTVLQETEKLPEGGGVFTPGAALLNTSLISRLQKEGIKYEVMK